MPAGSFVVDTGRTFTTALFMGSAPKLRFGTSEQDCSATGEKKWELSVACQWVAEFGMPSASDVIKVTCLGGTDPAAGLAPGTPVTFEAFKVGISSPEQRERKDGGTRVIGGKPFYSCVSIKPASGQFSRPPVGEKAA